MHLGPFSCLTKLGEQRVATSAKVRATKSRRNFSQRMHRIHPLDPKLTFWCVSYYLCAFETVWLPCETRYKMGRTSAKVRATMSRQNFLKRTYPVPPIVPKLMFWYVLYYLGAFGTIWLPYKSRCKTGRTSAKVRATKSRQIFLQRMYPVHPSGP